MSSSRVFGLDANIRFGRTDWNSYVIRTATPGQTRGQYAVRTSLNREGNYFHGKIGYLAIGEGFQDDLGYYRRTGAQKWFTDVGIRPRPESLRRRGVREVHPHLVWNYYTEMAGRMIGKRLHSGFTFFLNDGGFIEPSINQVSDELTQPFRLSPGAPLLATGTYSWTEYQVRYNTDPSRPVSFESTVTTGGLWDGTQRTMQLTVALRPSYRFPLTLGGSRTSIAPSQRNRSFLVQDGAGGLGLYYSTSERTLWRGPSPLGAASALAIAPKADGAALAAGRQLLSLEIENPHPEVSWRALFGKVWYEGYEEPDYVWQSTGGTDDFESKLSLTPLVFGTLKGTFYSLILAIPLGVFGAMFASQFLHPRLLAYVKPTVEIMAALPSVVLGFLAGLWLAPMLAKQLRARWPKHHHSPP